MALIIRENKCPLCEHILTHSNIHMPNCQCIKCLECEFCHAYFLDSYAFDKLHNSAYQINRKVKHNVYKYVKDLPVYKPMVVNRIYNSSHKTKQPVKNKKVKLSKPKKVKLTKQKIRPQSTILLNSTLVEKSKQVRLINPQCKNYKNGYCLYMNKKCSVNSKWCPNKTPVNQNKTIVQQSKSNKSSNINHEYPHYITVIILSDNRKCIYSEHILHDLNGIVKVVTGKGDIFDKTISIAYCEECDRFIMLKSEYLKLTKQYGILCDVIDYTHNSQNKYHTYNNLSFNESRIHRMGYNVIKDDKNTDEQRHAKLASMIENFDISRSEIISCIERPMRQHKNQSNYQGAVERWTKDIEFVKNYKRSDMPEVIINKMVIGKRI